MIVARLAIVCSICLLSCQVFAEDTKLVVHEWGTFTVLQDERGDALPGVNVNEESLPEFTYRLFDGVVQGRSSPLLRGRSKGIVANYAPATMRMETPIIYLYPPDDEPLSVDVTVRFQRGWISEWYPNASVDAPGFDARRRDLGYLGRGEAGSITWRDLQLNSRLPIPATQEHVWLAPRGVDVPTLSTVEGDAEKYLFYRGVANLWAPVRVVRDTEKDVLSIRPNHDAPFRQHASDVNAMWLVDVDGDGAVAYRRLEVKDDRVSEHEMASARASFAEADYAKENLSQLRHDMKSVLIAEGLFEAEAEAMLRTWELSYFKSAGLRVFFTLPRAWTDAVLPLQVSLPAEIARVMIGRVELVSPLQRDLLKQLNGSELSTPTWFWRHFDTWPRERRVLVWRELTSGTKDVTDLDVPIPRDYALYLQLGRFRESLLAAGVKQGDAEGLRRFARNYGISLN